MLCVRSANEPTDIRAREAGDVADGVDERDSGGRGRPAKKSRRQGPEGDCEVDAPAAASVNPIIATRVLPVAAAVMASPIAPTTAGAAVCHRRSFVRSAWRIRNHRGHGHEIGNRGEQADLQRVGHSRLFDDGREPETDDVDAARDAEIGRAEQPYAGSDEGVTQLGQPLLLFMLAAP